MDTSHQENLTEEHLPWFYNKLCTNYISWPAFSPKLGQNIFIIVEIMEFSSRLGEWMAEVEYIDLGPNCLLHHL